MSVPGNDRRRGGLLGLLVGDALGVPYEFHPPEQLPPLDRIEMTPPPDFHHAHEGTPPGTWSDDGAQALVLLASLLDKGTLDLDDLARALVAWWREGYMAVDGRVFDVGIQTSEALAALRRGTPPTEAGPSHEWANGNGSLMRVLPLALWHQGSHGELIEAARRQSVVTHGHLRAQLCCALASLWGRRLLEETPDPWSAAVRSLRTHVPSGSAAREELERHVLVEIAPTGSGYVVDTLHSARWALERGTDYEQVVRLAISLGHDTDTTACVAGGLAGIQYGDSGIPRRWLDGLRGQTIYEPLVTRLVGHGGP